MARKKRKRPAPRFWLKVWKRSPDKRYTRKRAQRLGVWLKHLTLSEDEQIFLAKEALAWASSGPYDQVGLKLSRTHGLFMLGVFCADGRHRSLFEQLCASEQFEEYERLRDKQFKGYSPKRERLSEFWSYAERVREQEERIAAGELDQLENSLRNARGELSLLREDLWLAQPLPTDGKELAAWEKDEIAVYQDQGAKFIVSLYEQLKSVVPPAWLPQDDRPTVEPSGGALWLAGGGGTVLLALVGLLLLVSNSGEESRETADNNITKERFANPWQSPGITRQGGTLAERIEAVTDTKKRPRSTATVIIHGDLGDGPRLVLGWNDGRWEIAGPDGTPEFSDNRLRLRNWVSGGTIGDVTGDGLPEVILYSSVALEASGRLWSGIRVFTRSGEGWRPLADLPTHPGMRDQARCDSVRAALAGKVKMDRGQLLSKMRLCPSEIGLVYTDDRMLHVFQSYYGRQHLRSQCSESGCSPLEASTTIGSDITSSFWARDGQWLLLGTGCWASGGDHAYGIVSIAPELGPEPARFVPLGGRTTITKLSEHELIALVGEPCERTTEWDAAARANKGAAPWRLRRGTVGEDGLVALDDGAPLDDCCAEGASLTILRNTFGVPAHVVIATRLPADAEHWRLSLYDVSLRHLDTRTMDGDGSRLRLVPIELTESAGDELLISGPRGTTAFEIGGGQFQDLSW